MSGRSQQDRLRALGGRLSDRDQAVLTDLVRLRFLTAGQIASLHFTAIAKPLTRTRRVQHQLARLVELDLVRRLERRQGGVRAGSSGFTYTATAEGQRLAALLAGQPIPSARSLREPGSRTVAHTLAGSALYVALVEADRAGVLELFTHESEPTCWRGFVGPIGEPRWLKPDAFVVVATPEYVYRAMIEIDQATEGSQTLRRKLATYVDYWRSGREQQAHDVFPRVVWIVPDEQRAQTIQLLIDELPRPARRIFTATTSDHAIEAITGGRP